MRTPTHVASLAQLAKYLPRADGAAGVVERRAQALAKQLGFRHTAKGYHVAACRKLCLEWYRRSIGGEQLRDLKRTKEVARLDILIARDTEILEQERLNTQRAKNAVMPMEDHTRYMLALTELFVSSLTTLTQRVGTDTRDARLTSIITAHVRRLRTELAARAAALTPT